MSFLKIIFLFSISLISFNKIKVRNEGVKKSSIKLDSTRIKAKQAFAFCKTHNFNTNFCILIDMSLHSGLKRFFVWDFKQNKILYSFLVVHGCCSKPWSKDLSRYKPRFSNIAESHCSSLGKYKIGNRAYSNLGVNIKYNLHGLESTNNNAFKRYIVLHSWELVSDDVIYPKGSPEGWGCPAISNKSFQKIDPLLKNSPKSVLMWIYN